MIQTFGFVPSNKFVNKFKYDLSVKDYLRYHWEYFYPFDEQFIIPSICPDKIEYDKGAEKPYYDFAQGWVGYPSLTVTWENAPLPAEDIQAIWEGVTFAQTFTNSRVWVTVPDGERGSWFYSGGVIDPIKTASMPGGNYSKGFSLTFGRLSMHLNDPSKTESIQISGDANFENNKWNY